ncbi:anti sigma factor C-terminal domain-containing protein [Liquorilactobacillus vini]|uniref:ECF-type sigma factor negative effector n=1 Tax=Liquorilactobacillus vini DSM 20605 TaxID=1133569 RepID=A0A0R2C2G4_9LACO|nr:anti sigma factor C-terminal domain-containing protein [Liquorilactobacillus vini]KRM85809.1 ECF-type sigma factor negative effector [Liquorilactobacillus vini DSM 20605]
MDEATKKMKKKIRKMKLQRLLLTIGLIILLVPVILAVIYKTTQNLASNQSWQLMKRIEIREDLLSPNIEASDNYLSSTSFLGGTVTSHRYKVIDGYRIPWSTLIGNYSWSGYQEDAMNQAGVDYDEETAQAYDRQTQQKIPLFYSLKHHYRATANLNQLKQIAQVKNSVAEVALTFSKPLTYQQIKKLLPDSVEQDWYWLGPNNRGDASYFDNNYLGFQATDEKPDQIAYRELKKVAKDRDSILNTDITSFDGYTYNAWNYARRYLKKYPQFKTAKYAGIIVSGQTQNLAQLKNARWIKYSSVGAVIKIKPYLQPNK